MPSGEHESPIALAKLDPGVVARLTTTYRSELLREIAIRHEQIGEARGKARAEARGWRRAVLIVLDARGVAVPAAVREQVLACTDLAQLETWLGRALTAATIDDVIRG